MCETDSDEDTFLARFAKAPSIDSTVGTLTVLAECTNTAAAATQSKPGSTCAERAPFARRRNRNQREKRKHDVASVDQLAKRLEVIASADESVLNATILQLAADSIDLARCSQKRERANNARTAKVAIGRVLHSLRYVM